MFAEEKARSRSPFKEKLLRPAGESLRLKIEEIRDEFMETGFVLAACYGAAFRQWKKLKTLTNDLRNYRLGFDGERYVAEKLGALTELGYRVFHDFICDMKPGGDATDFNFDHIVIGTNGIYPVIWSDDQTLQKLFIGEAMICGDLLIGDYRSANHLPHLRKQA